MKNKKGEIKDVEVFKFSPIGYVSSPFKDRFGVPRQPGLASEARGVIKLNDEADLKTALRSLEEFSHLWVIFVFHEHGGKKWKPSIRPPRLGGRTKVGVLASRSPHRPNPIGISAFKIEKIDLDSKGGPEITVMGLDLIDGTPVLDIKPYIPYADAISDANGGWASEDITRYPVSFSKEARGFLRVCDDSEGFEKLIVQILELDPRPAFQKRQKPADDPKSWSSQYGIEIKNLDVKYQFTEQGIVVVKIV